jgi:hypothetical protein
VVEKGLLISYSAKGYTFKLLEGISRTPAKCPHLGSSRKANLRKTTLPPPTVRKCGVREDVGINVLTKINRKCELKGDYRRKNGEYRTQDRIKGIRGSMR